MTDYVALLRAVNVGGRTLPMAELRSLCGELGFERTETYIQSGNLIFDGKGGDGALATALAEAIERRFGFAVPVIVRRASAWKAYVATNPFAGEAEVASKMLHLILAAHAPPADAPERLAKYAPAGERMRVAGDALWIDYGGNGAGRSKLTPSVIDRVFGAPATARNLNTVLKLQHMIEARE